MKFSQISIFTVALILPLTAKADEKGDAALKVIQRVYKARVDQMNPIHVRYRTTQVETPVWVAHNSTKKTQQAKSEGRVFVHDAEYARKDNKFWSSTRPVESISDLIPGGTAWSRDQFCLYNGTVLIRKSARENEYLLSTKSSESWIAPSPTYIVQEDGLLEALNGRDSGQVVITAMVSDKSEQALKVLALDLQDPKTKWRNKIELLPNRDFSVRRFDVFNQSGDPVDLIDVTSIEDVNGIPYPMKATVKHYMSGNRLGYTLSLEVLSVETGADKVPDSLFQFVFPKDSTIWDEDLKVYVRQTELSESHLDEVVRQLAPPTPYWKRWWVIAISVTIPILLIFATVRMRRGKAIIPTNSPKV